MKHAQQEYRLVPVADLVVHPDNPRRGNVEQIGISLRENGFYGTLVVQQSTMRVLAGNHRLLAAVEEGADVLPAMVVDVDDETALRIMLADNRLHDLGQGYDTEKLLDGLRTLADHDMLEGSGYTLNDLDNQLVALRSLTAEPVIDAQSGKREHRDPGIKELVLLYNEEQLAQVEAWLGVVAGLHGTQGVSETMFEALRVAARQPAAAQT